MATSVRTATARLCRAPGFRTMISRSPASMSRRMAAFTSRTDSAAQSTAFTSGGPTCARRPARPGPAGDLPAGGGAGPRLARLVFGAERGLERDLLVGDRDGVPGLGDDERLQAEWIFGEPERVGGSHKVAEAPVEITHRRLERLTERPAEGELPGEIEADDLGIVLGVEADALLLVDPTEAMVVADVPVVDHREIGRPVRPERLGVREVHAALRRQTRVPEAVRARPRGHREVRVEPGRRADLFHDLEPLA